MMHAKWYYFESLAQMKPETEFNIAQLNFLQLNLPWGLPNYGSMKKNDGQGMLNSIVPTFVVLPWGLILMCNVQRFLTLHKHLFPIRSL